MTTNGKKKNIFLFSLNSVLCGCTLQELLICTKCIVFPSNVVEHNCAFSCVIPFPCLLKILVMTVVTANLTQY